MEKENKDKLPVKPKDKEKNQNLGNKGSVLDFILIGEIGKGGYGRVWKAVHQLRGSFVAIKQIDLKRKVTKAQISALMMEIELLKELHHKNIVKYIDHHRTEKQLSIVMEYVENGSLADMVRHHGIFPETLVAAYMYQALDGLTYLHEQGVIHRDIKGANILISTDGTVKLADFGVATRLDSVGADADPAGSPYWMAPELISLEKGGLTTACDIWSLGCTVIELATGKPPYFDLPFATALYKIYSDDHPPLPEGISTGLKDFLMQCFQKDVNLRVSALKLMEHPWLRRAKAALAQQNTALDAAKNEIQAFQMAIQAAESTINTSPNVVVKKKSPRPKKDSPIGDDPNTPSKLESSGGHGSSSSGGSNLDKWKEEPDKKKPKSSGATAAKLSGKKVSATVKTPSGTTPSTTGTKKASDGTSGTKKPSKKLQIHTAQENELDKWKEVDELTNKLDLTPTPGAPKKEISPRTASKMASKSGEFFKVPAPVQKKPKVFKAKTINVKKSNRMDSDEELMGEGVANKLDQFKESESDDDFEKDFVTPQKKLKPKKLAGLERITQQLASLDIDENDPQTRENTLSGSKTVRQGEDVLFGKKLDKFTEADSDFTMDDIEFTSQSMDLNKLQLRLATNLQSNENEIPDSLETTDDYDTKANNESITDRIKEKLTRDFNTNVNKIRTETNEDELIKACDELCEVLLKYPEDKLFLLATNNGIMPMLELLESNNEKVTISALKLINTVVNSSKKLRDTICLLGGIPLITKYSSHLHCKEVRLQCAQFVKEVCNTKSLTLQMFIACGGLPSLVDFLEPDFSEFKDLIYNSLDAIWNIFELQTPTPKRAFCYLFVKSGLLSRLSVVLVNLAKVQAADPEADSYVQTVVKILLFFSKSDAQVTEKMCATDVLQPIKSLLRINVIKTEALLKLLHVIKNLSYDSHLRNLLINNGYIEVLTSLLEEQKAEKLEMIHNIALNSLFYLLQLNPQSQERAAIAGAIPPLMHLVKTRPILKEFALPLLFCLPKASEKCRELLWKHKGLDFFLTLLKDPHYFVDALVAISDWFGFEPEKVENVIKTPQNIKKIMEVFKFAEQPFAGAAVYSILEPIMSLVSASVDLNRAFSEAKLMQLLLNHYLKFVPNNDAFSKVNILKLVSNLFLHHANQLVIAEEIYPIVRKIHENQNEKVNVRNTAKLLLVAIQRLKRGSANMDQHTGGLKNQLHPSGSQSQPQFNAQAIESAHQHQQHHHSASHSLPSTPQKNSNSKS